MWLRRAAWLAAPFLFLVLFYFLPIIAVAIFALAPDSSTLGGSIARIAASPYYTNRILFTFLQAFLSTLLTLLLGLPLAYLFAMRAFPLKRVLRAAITVPFVMPPLVIALALQAYLGRDILGWIPLEALGPFGAILLAHIVYNTSLVVRIVGNHWENIPTAYIDAARTLGARPRQLLSRLWFPLARTTIASTALLVLLFSLTSFGIILLLGGGRLGTIETLVYEEVATFRPHYDVAALLGFLQLLTTATVTLLYVRLQRRAPAPFAPKQTASAQRIGLVGAALLTFGVLVIVAPFIALAASAFQYRGTWSLEPARILLDGRAPLGPYDIADALRNSLAFALGTVLLAVPFALCTAYALHDRPATTSIWHVLILLPLGTSAILVGLGFLLVFDGTPMWDLRATPARILLAHVLIAYPFATRVLGPGLDALHPRFRDAARTLGATLRQAIVRVEFPLLRHALSAAAIYAFAISLGEFGATLLLRRPEYTTLPLAIFDAFGRPGAAYRAQANVLALVLALTALAAFATLEIKRRRAGGDIA